MLAPSPLRLAAASRLRRVADRLAPPRPATAPRSPAPLIRFAGRWWQRAELLSNSNEEPTP
jgi:hypothetical protein